MHQEIVDNGNVQARLTLKQPLLRGLLLETVWISCGCSSWPSGSDKAMFYSQSWMDATSGNKLSSNAMESGKPESNSG